MRPRRSTRVAPHLFVGAPAVPRLDPHAQGRRKHDFTRRHRRRCEAEAGPLVPHRHDRSVERVAVRAFGEPDRTRAAPLPCFAGASPDSPAPPPMTSRPAVEHFDPCRLRGLGSLPVDRHLHPTPDRVGVSRQPFDRRRRAIEEQPQFHRAAILGVEVPEVGEFLQVHVAEGVGPGSAVGLEVHVGIAPFALVKVTEMAPTGFSGAGRLIARNAMLGPLGMPPLQFRRGGVGRGRAFGPKVTTTRSRSRGSSHQMPTSLPSAHDARSPHGATSTGVPTSGSGPAGLAPAVEAADGPSRRPDAVRDPDQGAPAAGRVSSRRLRRRRPPIADQRHRTVRARLRPSVR